ncbi:hypothetical protein [Serratia marcescens]|uniref:hypothetical protein n=1 Tax=Serratia marcescens TaxID=615 RepID=UPI000D732BF1|nr:hypothetical protein [Serratia marcescens]AWQ48583.1 hypothetical protein B1A42_15090 [Serratia marcescens]
MHALIKKSRYSSPYRDFLITYRPRTAVSKIARYEVSQGDQSYGLFDAKEQAEGYIDQLYSQHQAAA